jgi:hypothetical protein
MAVPLRVLERGPAEAFCQPIYAPLILLRRLMRLRSTIDDPSIRLRLPFLPPSILQNFLRQEISLISDRQLRQTIDGLRRLERKCFASRHRFAFYDYLAAMFELYIRLRRTKQAKKAAGLIAKLFGLRKQRRAHPIRVTKPRGGGQSFLRRSYGDPKTPDAIRVVTQRLDGYPPLFTTA